MKFDIVLSNPPYQKPGDNISSPLWPKFSEKFIKYIKNNGFIAFITPATWLNGNSIFKKIFLKYDVLFVNVNECKKHFKKVALNVTFSYWIVQNKFSNIETEILSKNFDNNKIYKSKIYFKDFNNLPTGWIDLSNPILGIHKKILNLPKMIFFHGPITSFKKFSSIETNIYKYKIHYSRARKIWSSEPGLLQNKNKVIIWHTSYYINKFDKNECITSDGIGRQVWAIDGEEIYVENIRDILLTKFYILLDKMYRQGAYFGGNNKFPLIDFSKKWTDNEIYKYFNLTQEEIDYIEKTII